MLANVSQLKTIQLTTLVGFRFGKEYLENSLPFHHDCRPVRGLGEERTHTSRRLSCNHVDEIIWELMT